MTDTKNVGIDAKTERLVMDLACEDGQIEQKLNDFSKLMCSGEADCDRFANAICLKTKKWVHDYANGLTMDSYPIYIEKWLDEQLAKAKEMH